MSNRWTAVLETDPWSDTAPNDSQGALPKLPKLPKVSKNAVEGSFDSFDSFDNGGREAEKQVSDPALVAVDRRDFYEAPVAIYQHEGSCPRQEAESLASGDGINEWQQHDELDAALVSVTEDEIEERAALVEEGTGAPREWAEAFARLDAAHPPGDIPAPRWRQFIDDAGRFLDKGSAARAKALGWSPLELFGCDRHRPLARVDNTGLIWLLRGRRLLALTAEAAIIENRVAPPHKYRRCITEPGRAALAWELVS
jgi:hypothetical protein